MTHSSSLYQLHCISSTSFPWKKRNLSDSQLRESFGNLIATFFSELLSCPALFTSFEIILVYVLVGLGAFTSLVQTPG